MIMNRLLRYHILAWLLLLVGSGQLGATTPDFDPPAPPEPYLRYKVNVEAEYGYTSGSGEYFEDEEVQIRTSSSNSNYYFKYWLKDGKEYTNDQEFTYKMEAKNVKFVAVFGYDPLPPDEPVTSNPYRLYLNTNKEGSCSFNRTSGEKTEAGQEVWLQAYASQGFRFEGWYEGDSLVSEEAGFNFLMPEAHTTLTAHFVYDPDAPGEPQNPGQDDVENGIIAPTADDRKQPADRRIYDLSGREVKQMVKGKIYIRNHRKIFP